MIPSPSPSVKIQIMSGEVCLRCKGKTLLGVVNKLFVQQRLLTMPSNALTLHLKQTFPSIIWIFTKGEGDGIESRLSFKIYSILKQTKFTLKQGESKFHKLISNHKNKSRNLRDRVWQRQDRLEIHQNWSRTCFWNEKKNTKL